MLKILSQGILNIKNISLFLKEENELYNDKDKVESYAGWGYKDSSNEARNICIQKNLPYISLEDGFLRSLDLGVNGAIPLSLSVDYNACYYNAKTKSKIEKLLRSYFFTNEDIKNAKKAIKLITYHNLSKYNNSYDLDDINFKNKFAKLNENLCKYEDKILFIDQTLNDKSLTLGLAIDNVFSYMYKRANELFPKARIFVKTHPDVLSHKKESLFSYEMQNNKDLFKDVEIISDDVSALSLLKKFEHVFVVTSQVGFEALLLNKKVYTFGLPFYAGYGLTYDMDIMLESYLDENIKFRDEVLSILNRRRAIQDVTLEKLFVSTYMKLCRYVNPIRKERTDIFDIISLLAHQKKINTLNYGSFVVYNIKSYKRDYLNSFLKGKDSHIYYVKNKNKAINLCKKYNGTLVQWASKRDHDLVKYAQLNNIKTMFIEDGFIRSRGLGSNHERPLSLVFDKGGIYYDPNSNSDLFTYLNNFNIANIDKNYLTTLESEVTSLKDFILNQNISKYNLSLNTEFNLFIDKDKYKKVILIPEQVSDDESVKCAGLYAKSNEELITLVRAKNEDSFIIFKRHPDVESKNRIGLLDKSKLNLVNLVLSKASITDVLNIVDEVHTLSSQTGFEAILRGIKVYTYGLPFYANFGLTYDYVQSDRRHNNLLLNHLLINVLMFYPRYFDYETNMHCRAIDICFRIKNPSSQNFDSLFVRFCRFLKKCRAFLFK